MSKRSVIPFGPQHPVLPEPIHLDLVMEDEKVVEAIPSIGFIHRGLEKLVDKKDFNESSWFIGESYEEKLLNYQEKKNKALKKIEINKFENIFKTQNFQRFVQSIH